METLRTPDDRFANLTGYPFAPHYFLREDKGEELAKVVVDFIARSR